MICTCLYHSVYTTYSRVTCGGGLADITQTSRRPPGFTITCFQANSIIDNSTKKCFFLGEEYSARVVLSCVVVQSGEPALNSDINRARVRLLLSNYV